MNSILFLIDFNYIVLFTSNLFCLICFIKYKQYVRNYLNFKYKIEKMILVTFNFIMIIIYIYI